MAKLFSSLLGVLRGGVAPREVGMAVFLGVAAGLVCGWNLTLVTVLLLVLVLRAPLKMFFQAFAAAAAVAWVLTPVTFQLGQFLLMETRVGDWLAPYAENVWLVLFDLERYTLLGGLALVPVLGLPLAWAVARVTRALQERFQALHAKIQAHQQWEARGSVRILCWLLFGGPERAKEPAPPARLFRTWGLAATVLLIAPAVGAAWFFMPSLMAMGILRGLSVANQAEVNAQCVELSLSQGLLYIQGLQVADPDDLDRDRFRIDELTAVLSPGPLLRGRVYVEKVLIDGIASDLPRRRRARRYGITLPEFGDRAQQNDPSEGLEEDGDLLGFPLPEYSKDWGQLEKRLHQVKGLLAKIEQLAARSGEGTRHEARSPRSMPSFQALRDLRHTFGEPRPRVWIQEVRVARSAGKFGLGRDATIHLTNVSSDPPMIGQPTRFSLVADERKMEVEATVNLHRPGTPHDVFFKAQEIELNKLVNTARLSDKFTIGTAKLSIFGQGTVTSQDLFLPLNVAVRDLDIHLTGRQKLAGLTPDLWNQGLRQLGGLNVESQLLGRWRSPRLRVDTKQLTEQFQRQLAAAGHLVLSQAVEEQLARGKRLVDETVSKAAEQATAVVQEQREKIDAAVEQGQQEIAKGVDAVEQEAARVEQQASDVQDKAQAEIDQTAQRATEEIGRGQDLAKQWLGDNNPLSKLGGAGELIGSSPLGSAADGLIDGAANPFQQQVQSGQQTSAYAVDNAAETATAPLDQAGQATSATEAYLNQRTAAVRETVEQAHGGVNDAVADSTQATGQATGHASQDFNAFLRGRLATQPSSDEPPTRGSHSAVGPYTELLPGERPRRDEPPNSVVQAMTPQGPPPAAVHGADIARRYGAHPGATAKPQLPANPQTPPTRSPVTATPYQYPSTPWQYPSTSSPSPPRHNTPPHVGQAGRTPVQRAPVQRSIPQAGPPAATRPMTTPSDNPTTRSRPPSHNRREPANDSDFYTDQHDPPYAYEAGGRYEVTEPPLRDDQVRRPPRETPPRASQTFFPGPPLPQIQNAPSRRMANLPPRDVRPPSTIRSQAPPRRPPPRQQVAPRQAPPPRSAPAQDNEWGITSWTRDAGTQVKDLIFGSPESGQLNNPQPRPSPGARTAHRPRRSPVYVPRNQAMRQPQPTSQPWYKFW